MDNQDFSSNYYYIFFGVFVLVCLCGFLYGYRTKPHPPKKNILLLGLPRSGKSVVFNSLAFSEYRQAGTSLNEGPDAYFSLGNRFRLIDSPGQLRIRYRYFHHYKKYAHAIVFIINAYTVEDDWMQIAEFLYIVINDPMVRLRRLPFLILCNRFDECVGADLRELQRKLERKIQSYKMMLSEQELFDPYAEDNYLGVRPPVRAFEFGNVPFPVYFASCPTLNLHDAPHVGLHELIDWITMINI